jgi:regulator of RNase E activity RraA
VRGVVGDAAGVVVVTRRRLTLDEAQRGVQPEPFTVHEWDAMHMASGQETREKHERIINETLEARCKSRSV